MRSTRARLASLLELIAIGLLCVPVGTVVIAVAMFAVGAPLRVWTVYVAAIVAVVAVRLASASTRDWAGICAVVALVHVAGLAAAIAVPDESWDGLWYHQEAVLQLSEGWNPLRESVSSRGTPAHAALWIDNYPKAGWIAAAPWFMSTGRIDASKVLNLTLLSAALCMLVAALLRHTTLNPGWVAWLAVIGAVNPVFVYQSTTVYADGLIACLLVVLATSLINFTVDGTWTRLAAAWLAMSFVINLKFTGLAYAVVCCGVAVVAAAAWRGRLAVLRLGASLGLVGLFSVAALGYAPYIRNLQEHGSMFYPLRGPDAYNIMTQDRPANLTHHNRVSRFVIATFSRTGNNMSPLSTELKYPWSVRLSELRALESLTGGGFGPLYAAALVAALAVLGVVAWLTRRSRTHLAIWVIAAATLASLFVHEEAWWARYVPQAWFLPWLVALGSLLTRPRWVRGAGVALLVLISADLALIGVGLARAQRAYLAGTEQYLREMRAAPKPVHVYLHAFPAFRRRLVEADIPYVEIAPPAYTSTRAELIARNYLPPEPVLPPGVERRPVYPHNKVFWYSPH